LSDKVVIGCEGLGKRYLIGHEAERERYVALRDVIARNARGLGRAARDMLRGRALLGGDTTEEFWALKDVSFEVKRGEVVGIIGRNGAGKSTLLKILSRITEPTEGRVTIRGRVGSLLEVGTGFHPELTGRENIYLNGAILGMTRVEIRRKFEEIVAFAEVEKFLDTPVKRYSSGMYVRLAFSVAAHLEPEILIIDEVLAVGDVEFQKKCLGKMSEVAGHGRTILFVSHNMGAIQRLCGRCIVLTAGEQQFDGDAADAVACYLAQTDRLESGSLIQFKPRQGQGHLRFSEVTFLDDGDQACHSLMTGMSCGIELAVTGSADITPQPSRVGIAILNRYGDVLFNCATDASSVGPVHLGHGSKIVCKIPCLPLGGGTYTLSLFLERGGVIEDFLERAVSFDVVDRSFFGTSRNAPPGWEGKAVLVEHCWSVSQTAELARAHS
jgi:lipopolysaccharide transport system ATP-binding protein